MLITFNNLLSALEVQTMRTALEHVDWEDGRTTAGPQAALAKCNQQLPESAPQMGELRQLVLLALNRHAGFLSAALPQMILPPFFNRYQGAHNHYGWHVDNAIRLMPDGRCMRSDLSATLFLSEPDEYDGGELRIEDTFGQRHVKLPAGSLVLYPSSSVHEVSPVTRGARLACFMFMQSLVQDPLQRKILYDMDTALLEVRQRLGDASHATIQLTGSYHNLLRCWASP